MIIIQPSYHKFRMVAMLCFMIAGGGRYPVYLAPSWLLACNRQIYTSCDWLADMQYDDVTSCQLGHCTFFLLYGNMKIRSVYTALDNFYVLCPFLYNYCYYFKLLDYTFLYSFTTRMAFLCRLASRNTSVRPINIYLFTSFSPVPTLFTNGSLETIIYWSLNIYSCISVFILQFKFVFERKKDNEIFLKI